uniref:DNA-directed RNA polymerase subunit beta' n=3 Tax=Pelargonium hortorum TaxID=4031 RepID=RPOC1_PELHO|nr:RNA polymerase beta' subunit 1 [Pelargonium x hortorum]Q06FX0.1 RecName: Full=DNA-directed RNA polymerase subunit beta'; AltName: Full=PEP; AltName: Full=Plastid-encoded RNA polymerase subunit beta'; Short=RNA polymerase subunit beta' [Pelargonium x hortorum]ABI17252.1 RNA polymerase beta' subunit 1 [Pelargonium x hortorum]AKF43457.1 RNA polymerase beta' subunit [Pelargonium x hortorum]
MIDKYQEPKHHQLRIGLVSPQQIMAWANKTLPTGEIVGEVKNYRTFSYDRDSETYKPERDGLFCERIFGPIKSGVCACGESRKIGDEKEKRTFCEKCGVEFVDSRIRRYQMGYIKLASPMAHVWYLKRIPSYIANLLDEKIKDLENLVYRDFIFAGPLTKKPTLLRLRGSFPESKTKFSGSRDILSQFLKTKSFQKLRDREFSAGAGAIRKRLANLDLEVIIYSSLAEWKKRKEQKAEIEIKPTRTERTEEEDRKIEKIKRRMRVLVRRMELAKHFLETNVKPEWMILRLLPVLPPELRPIFKISEVQFISSDLNTLYKEVISNNKILSDSLLGCKFVPEQLLTGQEKIVQVAVDQLLDNRISGQPRRDRNKQLYKSFSDILAGKEGRFRQTLLGRRVDYSGRSVIVVGPSLALHQCGLPREIALELFQTFIIRSLIRQRLASSVKTAKKQIREQERIVWDILEEVVQEHPVLLNRAPTLHRLGIQAFQPILTKERAIYLHPLVCKGFNADFDGDQMAVHLPLSLEAQAEAYLLMFSTQNLLSPGNGDPICVPTQDMLTGLYTLTLGNRRGICATRYNLWNRRNSQNERIDDKHYGSTKGKELLFCNPDDAIGAYRQKRINLDSPFWLKVTWGQHRIVSKELPVEVHYESLGTHHEIYGHCKIVRSVKTERHFIYIRTTVGHLFLDREIEDALKDFRARVV